jgi:hypothetical protein
MQLADELPMIYTVCILAYATFSYKRPVKVQILIGAALVGLAVFITVSANYFVLVDGYQLMDDISRFTISMQRIPSSTNLRTVS